MPRRTHPTRGPSRPRNAAHGSPRAALAIAAALLDLRAENASHPRFKKDTR